MVINVFVDITYFGKFIHVDHLLVNRGDVILLVAKSLKNPRSAVCKTAIMTSADIFSAYNDHMIDSLDPLVTCVLSTLLPC